MAHVIKDIESGDYSSETYDTLEAAKEAALSHVQDYVKGFEIIAMAGATKTPVVVYTDERQEASRVDLIDWDD